MFIHLFTNLFGWYAGDVSFPPSDVILAQPALPLSDIMFCLSSGNTNLFLYINRGNTKHSKGIQIYGPK